MSNTKNNDASVREQGDRCRKLFAAVALAAIGDAIDSDRRHGDGKEKISSWARSKDGSTVLSCAGIDPNARVAERLAAFVGKGIPVSAALSRDGRMNDIDLLAS